MGSSSVLVLAALAAGQPDTNDFVALAPDGKRMIGTVVRLAEGTAELAAAGQVAFKIPDVVSLRRNGAARPAFPRGPGLLTTTEDRIPGTPLGGTADALRFRPALADELWAVPIPAVAVAWLTTPPAGTPPDPDRISWLGPNRKRDVLRLRNGDTTAGAVSGFTDDGGLKFKPDAGDERAVPLDTVGAVAFNPALAAARRPKGAYTLAVLRDGTRLHLAGATADDTTLRGKTLFGQTVELPLAKVVALDTVRGKATDLSSLKPKAEQGGFLGVTWPWAADRTVRGEPLSVRTPSGIETFDRGLGTHPRTALTYELAGKYRLFEAIVGLDPVIGRQGRAVVRVVVDGKDARVIALQPGEAEAVRVELAGCRQLVLTVENGPAGDVQADVNWAGARLYE